MKGYQRAVVSATAILIALRLLFPMDMDFGMTLLHAFGIAAMGVGLYFLPSSRRTYALLATIGLVALRLLVPVQGWPETSFGTISELTMWDRFLLTLGIWSSSFAMAPPNWSLTLLHVVLILTVGLAILFRLAKRG